MSSAWAPFRHRMFAAMSAAAFISNVGSWMQTVGAQWLMLTLTGSATYVALVQSAASVPIFLFAVLAGTIGDLVDRRRFSDRLHRRTCSWSPRHWASWPSLKLVSPWSLLALIFGVGIGQALTSPTWQTLQPELVDPDERIQAISLGSVNQNLARAVGPAIGGAVLAATSAGVLFLINAATFGPLIGVIARWRGKRPPTALPREHVREAVRAGGRYVRASPVLRVVLLRTGLFSFFATSIWAVLPLIARETFHLGSGGYGLLLGCVGVGAVVGASLLPRLRKHFGPAALLFAGSAILAVVSLLLGFVHLTAIAALALAVRWFSVDPGAVHAELAVPAGAPAMGQNAWDVVLSGRVPRRYRDRERARGRTGSARRFIVDYGRSCRRSDARPGRRAPLPPPPHRPRRASAERRLPQPVLVGPDATRWPGPGDRRVLRACGARKGADGGSRGAQGSAGGAPARAPGGSGGTAPSRLASSSSSS